MKYGTIFSVHLTPRGPKLGVLGPKLGQIWGPEGVRSWIPLMDSHWGFGSWMGPRMGQSGVQNGSKMGRFWVPDPRFECVMKFVMKYGTKFGPFPPQIDQIRTSFDRF